ncbi:key lime pathogenicity protein [Drepanopeziza brunnea f. sp. 'multigermtubi' MB_m1]|uniref:Key lime pathogenicity protein n=1 Tax=Marssonina brunnea f. sp. multigermtubi (strain MB_m1) TaxID=1072389 RepID=K1WT46_MARBU|nr:key lime pathogenicity protein [Drepanopeziza brunnea f. sp. 'multigermtubi' MB_m1]EKD20820.1 key lime pathogenicity protein [Drepanopeziza brunnea f. sp. 'multigermtubi' MB_m1]
MASTLWDSTSMDCEDYEPEQRRQLLLAQRAVMEAKTAALDAELASLLPSSSQSSRQYHRSPIRKHHQQHRSSNVPRSMPYSVVPAMARHHSDLNDMSQRPRALSQRSASSMTRANSRGNSSQRANVPFTQNGAIPPPPLNSVPQNSAIMDWVAQEQPYTAYTYSQTPQLQRSTSQRNSSLEKVPELDSVGENPGDYITRKLGTAGNSPSISMPSSATFNSNNQLPTSYLNTQTPSTPTLDSATTLTSEMSRHNSLCTGLESMQMNLTSNYSHPTDPYPDQSTNDHGTGFPSPCHTRRSSDEEQSQLLVGTGGASHESRFPKFFQISSRGSPGEKMEKSRSNESISSSGSSSSSSRNVKRLQDQINMAAARPIMPKGGGEGIPMTREASSQSMARIGSKDGLQDKVAISKPTYQRPKHERVYCDQCDTHQDGFRGEHELRRHVDREHKTTVKKFVCIEPTDGGHHPEPIVSLSRCKACTQQKKKYGAYYNAAAHLRRAHFNPKTKGRSKNQPKSDDTNKRGGKGGGDYPPMSELKFWMKEVEEKVTECLTDAQQEAADASDDETPDNSIDETTYSRQPMQALNSNFIFDDAFLVDTSPIANLYPSSLDINSSDIFGMQTMPLDLPGTAQQTHCLDPSMHLSKQSNFPYFSDPTHIDAMSAFLNSSPLPPQSFENFAGWD